MICPNVFHPGICSKVRTLIAARAFETDPLITTIVCAQPRPHCQPINDAYFSVRVYFVLMMAEPRAVISVLSPLPDSFESPHTIIELDCVNLITGTKFDSVSSLVNGPRHVSQDLEDRKHLSVFRTDA